jgi:hypothetical protein
LDLGFQFWTPQNIPFESSSTSFVCAHPFDFEVGGVVIFLCSLDHLAYDSFNVVAWHLFLLFL